MNNNLSKEVKPSQTSYSCWECETETTYEGKGYWKCSRCNTSYFAGYDDKGNVVKDPSEVYDVAEIWSFFGKDKKYTFGYTEKALERALLKLRIRHMLSLHR